MSQPIAAPKNAMQKFLDVVERVGNKVPHPAVIFLILIAIVVVLSGTTGNIDIPRSCHNPKILGVDDAEIVSDRITEVRPIPRNFFTQETERRIGELGASRVGFMVRDMLVHHAR